MQTEVVMKRELWGNTISQKSKSEYFSATDLVKAGNKWRLLKGKDLFSLKNWLETKQTKEFINDLKEKYGIVKINSKGRNQHTWMHPYLFIDLALSISPKLKIEVYSWIMDSLLKYRNESGDSYKKMTGAVFLTISNKSLFREKIIEIANKIKLACDVADWQKATEEQLKLRDKIQENIALITDIIKNIDKAVDVSIAKALQ